MVMFEGRFSFNVVRCRAFEKVLSNTYFKRKWDFIRKLYTSRSAKWIFIVLHCQLDNFQGLSFDPRFVSENRRYIKFLTICFLIFNMIPSDETAHTKWIEVHSPYFSSYLCRYRSKYCCNACNSFSVIDIGGTQIESLINCCHATVGGLI